jgi:hypothetical protein
MPLSDYEKSIIRSPGYAGHISQLRARRDYTNHVPLIHEFPQYGLNMTKQLNTTITCTHCHGGRYQLVQSVTGHCTYEPCPICNKTGLIERNGM